ncbi:DUF3050 domain-containing protein [Pseudomonas asplenii]|uniref:DUF3050 domain-containing protein n=1 Tax=Pseudomonas asplenii TaxID=53407 RepID=UPI002361B08E|nr:DUF3050 domain-containing protein [Pseudomonas asplenii]
MNIYEKRLEYEQAQLLEHPVFSEVDSLKQLMRFMESHVFAVWDAVLLKLRAEPIGVAS